MLRVQKYGGSSLASVEQIHLLARRLTTRQRAGDSLVVVVSAMGATTEQLLAQAKALAPRPEPRELDMLLTAGERIAMALLAIAIAGCGGRALSLTGSQSGIITDEAHASAKILEVKPARIQQGLDADRIVIVAGFQGVSRTREVTTLGRGGSDTTAVCLTAALGAAVCEIYSDVAGVFAADPRLLPAPPHLPHLSYEMMAQMSLMGARVLAADAVVMAERLGIRLHLGHASQEKPFTQIAAMPPGPCGPITTLTLLTQAYALTLAPKQSATHAIEALLAAKGRLHGLHGSMMYVSFGDEHRDLGAWARAFAARFSGEVSEISIVTLASSEGLDALWSKVRDLFSDSEVSSLRMLALANQLSLLVCRDGARAMVGRLEPLLRKV